MDRFLIEWKALLKCIANIKFYVWKKLNKILILSLFPVELGGRMVYSKYAQHDLHLHDHWTSMITPLTSFYLLVILLNTDDHSTFKLCSSDCGGGQLSGKIKLNKIVAIATTCMGIGWVTCKFEQQCSYIPAIIYPTFNIKPLLPTATQATK